MFKGLSWIVSGSFLVASVAFAVVLVAPPAFAWKPFTHVRLAYDAVQEAKTGKVTFYWNDYANGKIVVDGTGKPMAIGTYNARKDLIDAINKYPEKYYAGVLGPDAYPDIITGQMITHPPGGGPNDKDQPDVNLGGPGTDFVLRRLWEKAHTEAASDANKAFVAGFLAHAAGDMYGHTYVNSYTGGIFDLVEKAMPNNALKHIVLEGYIAGRTKDLPNEIFDKVWSSGVSDGVAEFITKYANPYDFGVYPGDNKSYSFPYQAASFRAELQSFVDWYDGVVSDFDHDIEWLHSSAAGEWNAATDCRWWEWIWCFPYHTTIAAGYEIAAGGGAHDKALRRIAGRDLSQRFLRV